MDETSDTSGWRDPEQVEWYLGRVGRLAPRVAGEQTLVEVLPAAPRRMLDLGCGDGRLTALVLDARPDVATAIAIDRSPPMLERARQRFAGDDRVVVTEGDLAEAISAVLDGPAFDLVVSGFAIHHLHDDRKRALLDEVVAGLAPGGLFANLEVVASSTPQRHAEFLAAIGREADDPEDRLVDIDTQLHWMRDAGLDEVECVWRWRGFALLVGQRTL